MSAIIDKIEKIWDDYFRYREPFYSIREWYYDIRNYLFCRHDLIRTNLGKTDWWDVDAKMLYGMMNLLVEYVEEEECFEVVEWNDRPDTRRVEKEIRKIYAWWKNYSKREEEISNALTKWHDYTFRDCKGDDLFEQINKGKKDKKSDDLLDKLHELENKLIEEETKMLISLIKIRGYLWT